MNIKDLPGLRPPASPPSSGPARPFNIVLLYDSEDAATESRRMIDRVVGSCLSDIDVHRDHLSFLELSHPELRAETLELSAHCDFMIVATADGSGLPAEVLMWLSRWLDSRVEKETALLCLTGHPAGEMENRAVADWMRVLADRHNLPFFSGTFPLRQDAKHFPFHFSPRPEAWGINE